MTFRPLYQLDDSTLDTDSLRRTNAHTGLWYDKFCSQWGWNGQKLELIPEKQGDKEINGKLHWINTVANRALGNSALIDQYANRHNDLIEKLGGIVHRITTEGPFVTGLGREHPIENGFAWHHTLGTPFLPGSSLKGLIRAWAFELYLDLDDGPKKNEIKDQIDRIFGTPGQVGSIIFFDMIPFEKPILKADVITPHYSKYYQEKETPGDWLSPVPVPFLVVAPGAHFVTGFAPRKPENTQDLDTIGTWLKDALVWIGAGAKTASGYGRFKDSDKSIDTAKWQAAKKAEKRQRMTPTERGIEDAQQMTEDDALQWVQAKIPTIDHIFDDPYLRAIKDIIEAKFHPFWSEGKRIDGKPSPSPQKLKDEYATKLVPPPSQEELRSQVFPNLTGEQSIVIEELQKTEDTKKTNALKEAINLGKDKDWGFHFFKHVLNEANVKWKGRKSKQAKELKALKKYVDQLRKREVDA